MRVWNCILARPTWTVTYLTPSLSLCAAVRPHAPIVLWKLGFPPSLNTASKTFSQMLFLFQGSCPGAATAMPIARVLLQMTGCHVHSFALSTAPKLSIIFLPVCWTSFCGCPNLTSNSISPFRNSTFSFYACATPWISRNPEFAYISSPLRETLPLTYIAFIHHTSVHEMAEWRNVSPPVNPVLKTLMLFQDVYQRRCKEENTESGNKIGG